MQGGVFREEAAGKEKWPGAIQADLPALRQVVLSGLGAVRAAVLQRGMPSRLVASAA